MCFGSDIVGNGKASVVDADNVNDHRAAAKDIVFKSRAARGSVCIVLLSRVYRDVRQPFSPQAFQE